MCSETRSQYSQGQNLRYYTHSGKHTHNEVSIEARTNQGIKCIVFYFICISWVILFTQQKA